MELHLNICGVLQLSLAILHISFPKYFNWKTELKLLSLVNRQIMYIHTLFIAIAVALMGWLCLAEAHQLISTDLGRKISIGLGLFWLIRLIVQFVGYSPKLWRGKTFETLVHITFTFIWIYVTGIFFIIATS